MSDKQDVMLAMARVRRAIAKARESGGGHTTDAVEKLADVVDGLIAGLCAEPALRIDYLKIYAPGRKPDAQRSGT